MTAYRERFVLLHTSDEPFGMTARAIESLEHGFPAGNDPPTAWSKRDAASGVSIGSAAMAVTRASYHLWKNDRQNVFAWP